MLATYVHSGRCGVLTPIVGLIGVAMAGALGWVYQWLIGVIPLVFLDALLCAGLGLGVGVIGSQVVRFGKCRSGLVGAVIATLLVSAALIVSHYVAYQQAVGAGNQVSIADYIAAKKSVGWRIGRSKSGIPIKGFFVFVIWAIEALAVWFFGIALTTVAAGKPFCESCLRWADQRLVRASTRTPSAATVAALKSAADMPTLLDLPEPGPDAGGELGADELTYEVKVCPGCGGTATLSVSVKTVALKNAKKNERTETVTSLHEHVLLDSSELAAVTELVRGLDATAPPARA